MYIMYFKKNWVAQGLFHFCEYHIFIGSVVSRTLQLAFDYVIIACSLESIRPGLVQGCKAPNGVG